MTSAYKMEQAMSALMAARARADETEEDAIERQDAEQDVMAILEGMARSAREAEAQARAVYSMITDMESRRSRFLARAEALRGGVFAAMTALELPKLELPDVTLSLARGQPALVITDEDAIPAEYSRTTIATDRRAIIAALKAGASIPGAELSNGIPTLRMHEMSVTTTTQSPGSALIPTSFDQAMRLAEMMAKGGLVPSHLQGKPADCLMVIEQAIRWRMSPFAVAQATSVIQGKLMYAGTLMAAAVETCNAIVGSFNYFYTGNGNDRTVIVSARRPSDSSPVSVSVTLGDARTNNTMWTKQPDQQLAYHGTRVWARRYTPSVIYGAYAPEEMQDEPQAATFAGTTIDAQPEEPAPALTLDTARTAREIIDVAIAALAIAQSQADIDAVMYHRRAAQAIDRAGGEAINEAASLAMTRLGLTPATVIDPDPADDLIHTILDLTSVDAVQQYQTAGEFGAIMASLSDAGRERVAAAVMSHVNDLMGEVEP